jgi:hypothetical protein
VWNAFSVSSTLLFIFFVHRNLHPFFRTILQSNCLTKFYEKQGYSRKDAVGKAEKQVERELET